MEIIIHNLEHSLMITIFVFVIMIFVDYFSVLTKGKMNSVIKGGVFRQYTIASFLGATPGCLGAFMNVSFYVHGLISFGAIVGGMIATSGDEAFVMLAMFPGKALTLFLVLFFLGIVFAWLVDKVLPILRIRPCEECRFTSFHLQDECRCLHFNEVIEQLKNISLSRFLLLFLSIGSLYCFCAGIIGPDIWNWKRITFVLLLLSATFVVVTVPDHYLEDHIWQHIAKQHLWKIFLWSFSALLVVDYGLQLWNLKAFVETHMVWVLLIAGLVAIIPGSGPHLMFVTLFAKELIPFSVLLASSIIQDGHGMLPLLSFTLKDSLLIKLFNLIIGLAVGFVLFSLGY